MEMQSGQQQVNMIDYRVESDNYWGEVGLAINASKDDEDIAALVSSICGIGNLLDIGSGDGGLVTALLKHGIDARGIDVSGIAVSRSLDRAPNRFSRGNVLSLPFNDESFETIVAVHCVESLAPADVALALREIYRVARRFVFLKITTSRSVGNNQQRTFEGRPWWELKCFEVGFRKHPLFYQINPYESLNGEGSEIIIPLEKIAPLANGTYPLSALREERDLHMDMLREHGSRSDAHVGRYHFASRYVRPGDVVLDVACGLGYGSHVIHSSTKCAKVTGIDGSAYGVDYAAKNYSLNGQVTFVQGYLPDCLADIRDHSVDTIICFETLEHVESPTALLTEFHRILTPGGRLIASVPHDWSDETGEDPNPFHFHVYDRKRFLRELSASFDVEQLFGQTADRVKMPGPGCQWSRRPRSLDKLDTQSVDAPVEAEWLLAVVCKSPVNQADVPYNERVFSEGECAASGNALAFARDYENPWLVRSIVSIGLRTENGELREKWALETLEYASTGSADYGAALCILAYLSFERQIGISRNNLTNAIDRYVSDEAPANPNALRWKVSLNYVRALIELATGNREMATRYFQRVIEFPSAQYSPTLLTKSAQAAYLVGLIHAADGELELANLVLQTNFRKILIAIGQHLGHPYATVPPAFELREVASIVSFAGRLAAAASNLHELSSRPAVFHAQVEDHIAAFISDLLKGKEWLELAYKTGQAKLLEQDTYLVQVVEGKDWLEAQWKSAQANLVQVVEGKDWLEAQWKSTQAELATKESQSRDEAARFARLLETQEQRNAELLEIQRRRNAELLETNKQIEAKLREESARIQLLLDSFPVRVLRKLGIWSER